MPYGVFNCIQITAVTIKTLYFVVSNPQGIDQKSLVYYRDKSKAEAAGNIRLKNLYNINFIIKCLFSDSDFIVLSPSGSINDSQATEQVSYGGITDVATKSPATESIYHCVTMHNINSCYIPVQCYISKGLAYLR